MKIIINLWIILQCFIGFVACNFLETTPTMLTPSTFFNTDADVKSFLTTVYAPLANSAFYGYAYERDIQGDDLGCYNRSATTQTVTCAQLTPATPCVQALWSNLYTGIDRANMLLENAGNATMDSVRRVQYKSEARFLRAYYYFTLVQNYGSVPLVTSTAKDMTNLSHPRYDKQKLYDFIITEMVAAEPNLLAATVTNPGQLTRSAAQGVLARVYLFRAGEKYRDPSVSNDSTVAYFTHARDWALKVNNSGIHGLANSYGQVFIDLASDQYNSTGVKESIWEVEFAGNNQTAYKGAGNLGCFYGFGGPNLTIGNPPGKILGGLANPGYSYGFIYCTTKLYTMYAAEKDSARSYWNIAPFTYTSTGTGDTAKVTGRKYYFGKIPKKIPVNDGFIYTVGTSSDTSNYYRPMAKYRREYEVVLPKDKNTTPINFPILRFSDVLLMIAEAENEVNGPANALQYLNQVRKRAGISQLVGLTQTQLRDKIKTERALELCFEGTRRLDLIRWGDYLVNMTNLANSIATDLKWPVGSKVFANYYNINSSYLYLPIPATELAVNTAITSNNPGW